MRIVFDTNVVISVFLSKSGAPRRALEWAIRSHADILSCAASIAELREKLALAKFDRYLTGAERADVLQFYIERSEMVVVPANHGVTASVDPDDNLFLALAGIGGADALVSGDKKHLLPLGTHRNIPILSPADFLARIS
jgi:uncharacterized protein